VETFPEEGLAVNWRAPVASGYAGPAVAEGRIYLMDYMCTSGDVANSAGRRNKLEGQERVLCLNADDGSVVWKHEYDCRYEVSYPGGPRATPTVTGGKVYTLGAMGHLRCLDAKTGTLLWSKDLKTEYETSTPHWGFTGHPLVDGKKLICLVGGKGSIAVAFDKDSGVELWRSLSAAEPGYCPPTMISSGGTRQLIIWHSESINGLAPDTGDVYWTVPLKPDFGMSIATPRKSGVHLFACGVRSTAALLKLGQDEQGADVVWRGNTKTAMYCGNSSPFIDGDVIYGVCQGGELRAVDLQTGQRLWETYDATTGDRSARYATAFLVKHDDRYFLFNDQGDLILARLSREGYDEISRMNVLKPTNEAFGRDVVWSHPAFANRSVYARNDQELVCVSLADR
jgi:outer membrane protein assembly factor BamB